MAQEIKIFPENRSPEYVAGIIKNKITDPTVRELITKGLIFSRANLSAQEVLEIYAPMLTEIQIDFAIRHSNDSEDVKARELSHKFMTKMADFSMKRQGVEQPEVTEGFKQDANALNKLLEIQEALTKRGMSIKQVLDANQAV